jgi:O-antigen/teichoic acid export membrane protein
MPRTRHLVVTTLALASSGATTLIFNLVLVRALAPSAYGGVARTFALGMAVAQMTMAGISPAIARRVAHADTDDYRFSRASGALPTLAVACGATSLLFFPLALVGLAPRDALSLLLGWGLAFVYANYFGLKLLLFVLDRAAQYALLEFTSDAMFFTTLALLAMLAPTAGLLTFSLSYSVFIVRAARIISRRARRPEPVSLDRHLITYAGWASVATYASVGRFTFVIVLTGALAGPVTAGQTAAILAILAPLFLVPQTAAMLTFAQVARTAGRDAGREVRRMCRMSGWVSVLTTATCCLFAHEVVRALLGANYGAATDGFVIVILCAAPQMLAPPIGNALSAEGNVVLTASLSIGVFILMVVALLVLVPPYGLDGAALAFGLSLLVSGFAAIVIGRNRFQLRPRDLAGTATALALGLAVLPITASPFIARLAGEASIVALSSLTFVWVRRRSAVATLSI